ncbi:MAG: recombinase family protein [Methylobacter sp.]|nr:recombinase family protein [Methylobacter sp.]
MKIGYARVSTNDQDTQLQMDALHAAGCERIYQEKQSGAKQDRLELQQCLKSLRAKDVLIVWKLDRLGRSLQHLIEVVADLDSRRIGFQSLTEHIDTTSPAGKLIFHIFGSLAEFERGLIRERVRAGLAAAKKKGKQFGRPQALTEKDKAMAVAMFNGGAAKIDIARHFKVTRQTVYAVLKACEP